MPTETVGHSLAASRGCDMPFYIIMGWTCSLSNNRLMWLGNGMWHCENPFYVAIQFYPFTFKSDDFGGASITLVLFGFRKTVVALVLWAGAPFCSNHKPLLFLNMGKISVWSTSCWYGAAVRLQSWGQCRAGYYKYLKAPGAFQYT